MSLLYQEITEKILAACFAVRNELGAGFLESVYQNALLISLEEKGLTASKEFPLSVSFHGKVVGQFYADILVEEKVMLELKAISASTDAHKAQLINYLKGTGIEDGLLINFGSPRLEYIRLHK
jgi:GxxExxY protein